VLGFLLYLVIGWLIAFFYYLIFEKLGMVNWWVGAITGFVHGMLLLTAFRSCLICIRGSLRSTTGPMS